jgi:hypothetical protein
LPEEERVALLLRELASGRLLANPFAAYSDETRSELGIVRAAADAHAAYGPGCITTYLISKAESVSDLLEVNILLKEAGLWRPGEPTARSGDGGALVRDHRRSRARAGGDGAMAAHSLPSPQPPRPAGTRK